MHELTGFFCVFKLPEMPKGGGKPDDNPDLGSFAMTHSQLRPFGCFFVFAAEHMCLGETDHGSADEAISLM